jgi:hypothetical protein
MNANIFLNENFIYIAIIILVIFGLLVYINYNNIELDKPQSKKLIQTVTVETFGNPSDELVQNIDFSGANSFCESYRGNSSNLNIACKGLTDENCSSTSCCVLVQGQNGNTCMAGNATGPTFKKDADGKLISMDAYYYEGKKYPGDKGTIPL